MCYDRGIGVKQSHEKAIKLFRLAADDDAEAKFMLATYYFEGKVVQKDVDKGMALFKQSAEAGDTDAVVSLALRNLDGTVPVNTEEAAKWLDRVPSLSNDVCIVLSC